MGQHASLQPITVAVPGVLLWIVLTTCLHQEHVILASSKVDERATRGTFMEFLLPRSPLRQFLDQPEPVLDPGRHRGRHAGQGLVYIWA
jgi:hypothetical protein